MSTVNSLLEKFNSNTTALMFVVSFVGIVGSGIHSCSTYFIELKNHEREMSLEHSKLKLEDKKLETKKS